MRSNFLKKVYKISDYLDGLEEYGKGPFPGAGIRGRYYRVINNIKFLLGNEINSYIHSGTVGYMINLNLELYKISSLEKYYKRSIKYADFLVNLQRKGGYWPLNLDDGMPPRAHTIDSCEASRSLFNIYNVSNDKKYLDSALRWCALLLNSGIAQNKKRRFFFKYYISSNVKLMNVSNEVQNTPVQLSVLEILSNLKIYNPSTSLYKIFDDLVHLAKVNQQESGEFSYTNKRKYYQQPQYNSFENIWLRQYFNIAKDQKVKEILKRNHEYLLTKVNKDGSVPSEYPFGINKNFRYTYYHSAAIGAAISSDISFREGNDIINGKVVSCVNYILEHQNEDGSFPYSKKGIFGIFNDNLCYPYKIAMIGYHLSIIYRNLYSNS